MCDACRIKETLCRFAEEGHMDAVHILFGASDAAVQLFMDTNKKPSEEEFLGFMRDVYRRNIKFLLEEASGSARH